MKRFIAVAFLSLFVCVGSIVTAKAIHDSGFSIKRGVDAPPLFLLEKSDIDVLPIQTRHVNVYAENDVLNGFLKHPNPTSNSPPFTRYMCK